MLLASPPVDVLHANYWLSGAVAHKLKHQLDLPLVATFHTLARVKADAGFEDDRNCAHRARGGGVRRPMLASTDDEHAQLAPLYDADPDRIEVVAPGVDHTMFAPGDRAGARASVSPGVAILFVGRIQPLKGLASVRCLAELEDPDITLLIVGGPSGVDGEGELARTRALVEQLGVEDRALRSAAAARAARRVLPRRRRLPGAVAHRVVRPRRWRQPRGTPVVAAPVGGLRSLVDDARTGFLVEGRDPVDFCDPDRAPPRRRRCSQTTWARKPRRDRVGIRGA